MSESRGFNQLIQAANLIIVEEHLRNAMSSGAQRPETCIALRLLAMSIVAIMLLLTGCASAPEVQALSTTASGWSHSAVITTNNKLITLFDPVDLAHHEQDPEDWYRYDFAHADDLATGRFVAVMTARNGQFNVRITNDPLNDEEVIAAGPRAIMRLRVINDRLLLSGGEAWPSIKTSSRKYAFDPRWFAIENGDYKVIVTAMNTNVAKVVDYVFQIIPVDDMKSVKYAPGLAQLIVGKPAGVLGFKAEGYHYPQACQNVPATASWVAMGSEHLPISGTTQEVELPRAIHEYALSRSNSQGNFRLPLVMSRESSPGSIGYYIEPAYWDKSQLANGGLAVVSAPVVCTVKIMDVVPDPDNFKLAIKPFRLSSDKLSSNQKRELVDQFSRWARVNSVPGWRFHTSMAERARDDSSLILGVISLLKLNIKEAESLLQSSNSQSATYLIDRFPRQ